MNNYRILSLEEKIIFIKKNNNIELLEGIQLYEIFRDDEEKILDALLQKDIAYSKDFYESIIIHNYEKMEVIEKVLNHPHVYKSAFYMLAKSGIISYKIKIMTHSKTPLDLLDKLFFHGNENEKNIIKSNKNYVELAQRILNKIK